MAYTVGQPAHTIRVLVAAPAPILREGIAAMLSSQPEFAVVGVSSGGANVAQEVRRLGPDILLLEADPASAAWMRTLRSLARSTSPVQTILLSEQLGPQEVCEAIELGVRGVLPKNAPTEALFKCIRCISAGEYWIGRDWLANAVDYLQRRKRRKSGAGGDEFGLTPREKDVVRGVLAGFTNKEIAEALGISGQAIRHHLSRIFEKYGVPNRVQLALVARRRGISAAVSPRPAS